ncbi:MAG: hypothetical protein JHD16_04425 [Solirubrobacteraceae bacterium]|nr:hypothetical protein [Solirubrobacteraceae bacterium]
MTAALSIRHGRRASTALFVAAVVGLAVASPLGAAMLSPAIALAAAVWFGFFTGERSIAWVRRVATRLRRARRPVLHTRAPRTSTRAFPAGASRAFALAMRPPPAADALR